MQLYLFRLMMAVLINTAPPGTTGCNAAFTLCWIRFENPTFVEYLSPNRLTRLGVVIELARAGLIVGE